MPVKRLDKIIFYDIDETIEDVMAFIRPFGQAEILYEDAETRLKVIDEQGKITLYSEGDTLRAEKFNE